MFVRNAWYVAATAVEVVGKPLARTLLNERVVLFRGADGRAVALHRMGNAVAFDQRPMRTRVHAVELHLPPGVPHLLLLRVATQSAMLVPISLVKPAVFHADEAGDQLLQGVLVGMALALLAYSLTHWATLRDPMFLEYALLLSGVTTFFVVYFGIGQQHLWNEQTGLLAKAAPLGVQGVLKSTRMAWNEGEAEAARHLFVDMVPVMQSEDAAEGVASFMQRREAVFKGR